MTFFNSFCHKPCKKYAGQEKCGFFLKQDPDPLLKFSDVGPMEFHRLDDYFYHNNLLINNNNYAKILKKLRTRCIPCSTFVQLKAT